MKKKSVINVGQRAANWPAVKVGDLKTILLRVWSRTRCAQPEFQSQKPRKPKKIKIDKELMKELRVAKRLYYQAGRPGRASTPGMRLKRARYIVIYALPFLHLFICSQTSCSFIPGCKSIDFLHEFHMQMSLY